MWSWASIRMTLKGGNGGRGEGRVEGWRNENKRRRKNRRDFEE